MNMNVGQVYLIGAGPGDPGLITLRGVECLARADVVLYDYLANPGLLRHARPSAERICLGKHGGAKVWTQAEINATLVERALAGQTVARLKGGDPTLFGRASEECAALTARHIPFEIVPGVTAALAAAAYADVPLTHRDCASAVAFVTGQENAEKETTDLDFAALARFPGTLVFYMGLTTVESWSRALIDAGKPADTGTAVIRRTSCPDQETLVTTLGQVAGEIAMRGLRPPVIFIIGSVAGRMRATSWFTERPLFGQRVMVTRAAEQADDLRRELEELGAAVVIQPAIRIGSPADWRPLDDALARLNEFQWLVFSSANGVRFTLDRLLASGRDLRAIANCKLAAIGPGTADALAAYHLRADLQPTEFRAESLAAALQPFAQAGHSFLLLRASRGREVLADELHAAGGRVTQVVVYQSDDETVPDSQALELLRAGKIDWITVTSSAIARSLVKLFGDDLRRSKLVSISPITSATLREHGFEPTAEANPYTMAGVVAAIRS